MLNQRINFGHAMRPFAGYELDCAIGTTYSLSLEALLFLPLSLFFGEELEYNAKEISPQLLQALTKVPERVRVFCQRGKIAKPAYYHNILAFWESSIDQVQMGKYNQSFHPKLWLMRYVPREKGAPVLYKLFCTSRNLTMCKDWDIAVEMHGTVVKQMQPQNGPLKDFLAHLDPDWQKKTGYRILEEIMNIAFEKDADELGYQFHAMGLGKSGHPLLSAVASRGKLLIMSPFLDDTTISKYRKLYTEVLLFSSGKELRSLKPETLQGLEHVYQFNPVIERNIFAEYDASTSSDDEQHDTAIEASMDLSAYSLGLGLHAKLYIHHQQHKVSWYIGSANATDPATGRNIEFMTEILFPASGATTDTVRETLTNATHGQGLFVPFERQYESADSEMEILEKNLRQIIFEICRLTIDSNVFVGDDNLCSITYYMDTDSLNLPSGYTVSLRPLSCNEMHRIELLKGRSAYIFSSLNQMDLTPFLVFTVHFEEMGRKEFVIHSGLVMESGRLSRIFASIINSQDKLLQYLASMLSGGDGYSLGNLIESEYEAARAPQPTVHSGQGLYEKLLLAAAADRQKIRSATELLKYIGEETDSGGHPIATAELRQLLTTFESFCDEI